MPVVFTSRVFSVEVDRRRFPDGREHEIVVVRHPPSVILIPIADDGRVVMIRQYRAPLDRVIWELPAGNVNPGETPEAAAVRECEEEIHLVPSRIERVGAWYPSPGYCDEEMIFFKVSGLQPPSPDSTHHADEDEDIEARPITVDEARELLRRREIVDLKTAYALSLL